MSDDIPSWGRVSARPHECLVVLRNGEIRSLEQGGSVFKWPADSIVRVDTSVRRLKFTADQVTREKTGVAVTGLAVFRIVQPAIAYKMLDLSDPAVLTDILQEMFVGATRRLVANLTLEDCMTRRKDALAEELLREVAPVVSGTGRVEDDTDAGWGVAIDTIEIQDVRVLSDEVFDRLQAPYRENLALEALAAEQEVARERARQEQEAREAAETRRQQLMELEEARLKAERDRARRNLDHDEAMQAEKTRLAIERQRVETDAEGARNRRIAESAVQVARLEAEAEVELAELRADAERKRGETEAGVLRMLREAQDAVSEARLKELALTETLPRVAEAFAGSFDQAIVTGGDLSFLSAGVAQVMGTLQAFGLELGSEPAE